MDYRHIARLLRRFKRDLVKLERLNRRKGIGSLSIEDFKARVAAASPEQKLELLNHETVKKETQLLSDLFLRAQAELKDDDVAEALERLGYSHDRMNSSFRDHLRWFDSFYNKAVMQEELLRKKAKGKQVDLDKLNKLEHDLVYKYEKFKMLIERNLEKTIEDIENSGWYSSSKPSLLRKKSSFIGTAARAAAASILLALGGQAVAPSNVFAAEQQQEKKHEGITLEKAIENGDFLYKQEYFEDALGYYQKAEKLDSERASTHFKIARTLGKLDRIDDAFASYDRAVELDRGLKKWAVDEKIKLLEDKLKKEKDADAYVQLSDLYYEKGNVHAYGFYAEKAIKLDPKHSMAHNNFGHYLIKLGLKDKAEKELKLAIELDKKNSSAYINFGLLKLKEKNYEETIQFCKKAIKLGTKDPNAHFNLGLAYHHTRQHDKAADSYEKAVKLDPTYVKAQQELGVSYFHLGRIQDAINQFNTVLRLDPNHKNARQSLNYIYQKYPQYKSK